jgi:3-phenylpropionate/trans-cinnamate dioxygenase ferredoxin reductase subunit
MGKDGDSVIVGAGQSGAWTATTLRDEGYVGRVVLIGDESHVPYERPPLSKGLLAGNQDAESCWIRPADHYAGAGIELRLHRGVETIDRANKELHLSDGETIGYGRLVLAMGARPRRLMAPGSDLPAIHYLRTIDDSLMLKRGLAAGTRILLIGGGYIGLEVAATAVELGCHVTVIEALPEILARAMPPELSREIARRHRQNGVVIETGVTVEAFEESNGALRINCTGGRTFEADVVVVGIGAIPNDAIVEAAGIRCDDGIVVDEFGRTSDDSIFAAGDVTRHFNPVLGRHIRLESWQNAQNQAIATARNLRGSEVPYAEVPWFWSNQFDMNIQAVGLPVIWDQVVFRGEAAAEKFSVFSLSQGIVVSAHAVNAPRDIRYARQLISGRKRPDPLELADPTVPLKQVTEKA